MADDNTRVLIVEDDETYRELLVLGLTAYGYDCESAENGAAAMESTRAATPELILLDMLMPVMDGLRFLHWLKDDAKISVPSIVLTCLDDKSFVVDALVAGASDVLVKPVTLEVLVERIGALL